MNRSKIRIALIRISYFQKIKKWAQKQSPDKMAAIGVYDSKMTLQFLNQFLTGEEIAQVDDRFLPTPVSLPVLGNQNKENSKAIRQLIPICNFAEQQNHQQRQPKTGYS